MEKMNKQALYEIYRACRLCGSNAGYKMPIVQNIISMDDVDLELRQKIKECVHIEVTMNDRMPPLICEPCIEKVNTFFDFLQVCKITNINTRKKLGLPLQTTKTENESMNVTEPVLKDKELQAKNTRMKKVKENKEPEAAIKDEAKVAPSQSRHNESRPCSTRLSRPGRSQVTPPRTTRQSKPDEDNVTLNKLVDQSRRSKPVAKTVENNAKKEDTPRPKKRYSRELQLLLGSPPVKKARTSDICHLKTQIKQSPKTLIQKTNNQTRKINPSKDVKTLKRSSVPPRKSNQPAKAGKVEKEKPVETSKSVKSEPRYFCDVCQISFRESRYYHNHVKMHSVAYTQKNKACNACQEWFTCVVDALKHHAEHKSRFIPYRCMLCSKEFETNQLYEEHIIAQKCRVSTEVPDRKCEMCWKYFPTKLLLDTHKCLGKGDRPAKCIICKGTVAARNLKKHEKTCVPKKGTLGSAKVDQDVLDRLKPMQVRLARCDPLLKKAMDRGHVDVSSVRTPYGLDRSYYYPYVIVKPRMNIKTEPNTPSKHDINDGVNSEFGYKHWDSDEEIDNEAGDARTVSDLRTLCLKVIYSPKMLGKVPKRRKTKMDLDDSEFEVNIDSVIKGLDDETIGENDDDDKNGDRNANSPKLGIIESYTSLADGEDYISDVKSNEVFRGFDLSVKEASQSDDSQSVLTVFDVDLMNGKKPDESVSGDEEENSVTGSVDKDLTEVSQIMDTEVNTKDSNNTDVIKDGLKEAEQDTNDMNASKVDKIENMDVTHNEAMSIITNTAELCVNANVGLEVINENIVSNIENLKDESSVSGTDNDIDKNNIDHDVVLNVNEDNSFLQNKDGKEEKSYAECYSSDDALMRALDEAIDENGGTSKDITDENMYSENCLDVNSESFKQNIVHKGINDSIVNSECIDNIGQVGQSVTEFDKCKVDNETNFKVQSASEVVDSEVNTSIESLSLNKNSSSNNGNGFDLLNDRSTVSCQSQTKDSVDFNKECSRNYTDDKGGDYNKENKLSQNVKDMAPEKEEMSINKCKVRDGGLDGMDLDNISDEEFNFD